MDKGSYSMWPVGWRLWETSGTLSQIHIQVNHGLLCKTGDYSDHELWESIYKCLPLVSV